MIVRRLLQFILLLVVAGCASTPSYPGKECESVADFDECVQCFVSNNWIGSASYKRDPKSVEFLIDSGQFLAKSVADGRVTRTRARTLFSYFMRNVGTRATLQQSALLEAGIPLNHSYLLAQSIIPAGVTGSSAAPCVYGGCGSVQVNGYFRKDGTYVRPHTRSAPRSGGRRR